MKPAIILAILLIIIAGCSSVQEPAINATSAISGTADLMLNEQDFQQLGLAKDTNETNLQ